MQTFLPYPDFSESAACLDDKRLRNQVKECAQIMASLVGGAYLIVDGKKFLYSTGGYPDHPATKMWDRRRAALCVYALACVHEMRRRDQRGMKVYDQMFREMASHYCNLPEDPRELELEVSWPGGDLLHRSHRSQLLAKDPDHYGKFGWVEKPGRIPYYWPV